MTGIKQMFKVSRGESFTCEQNTVSNKIVVFTICNFSNTFFPQTIFNLEAGTNKRHKITANFVESGLAPQSEVRK